MSEPLASVEFELAWAPHLLRYGAALPEAPVGESRRPSARVAQQATLAAATLLAGESEG